MAEPSKINTLDFYRSVDGQKILKELIDNGFDILMEGGSGRDYFNGNPILFDDESLICGGNKKDQVLFILQNDNLVFVTEGDPFCKRIDILRSLEKYNIDQKKDSPSMLIDNPFIKYALPIANKADDIKKCIGVAKCKAKLAKMGFKAKTVGLRSALYESTNKNSSTVIVQSNDEFHVYPHSASPKKVRTIRPADITNHSILELELIKSINLAESNEYAEYRQLGEKCKYDHYQKQFEALDRLYDEDFEYDHPKQSMIDELIVRGYREIFGKGAYGIAQHGDMVKFVNEDSVRVFPDKDASESQAISGNIYNSDKLSRELGDFKYMQSFANEKKQESILTDDRTPEQILYENINLVELKDLTRNMYKDQFNELKTKTQLNAGMDFIDTVNGRNIVEKLKFRGWTEHLFQVPIYIEKQGRFDPEEPVIAFKNNNKDFICPLPNVVFNKNGAVVIPQKNVHEYAKKKTVIERIELIGDPNNIIPKLESDLLKNNNTKNLISYDDVNFEVKKELSLIDLKEHGFEIKKYDSDTLSIKPPQNLDNESYMVCENDIIKLFAHERNEQPAFTAPSYKLLDPMATVSMFIDVRDKHYDYLREEGREFIQNHTLEIGDDKELDNEPPEPQYTM